MKQANIIINKIEGCQEGILIVEEDGFFYVGMKFDRIGVQRFACSPSYKTVTGAERFAKKTYKM